MARAASDPISPCARIPGATVLRDGRVVIGWVDAAVVVLGVAVYLLMPRSAGTQDLGVATGNAHHVLGLEALLGLRWEPFVQRVSLRIPAMIVAANIFYGSLHFVVPVLVFVWLYRRHVDQYPDWRNAFSITSGLSLAIFAIWPVAPPRLLTGHDAMSIQDTLATHTSLWSFAGPMGSVANELAAMPSVHCAWATIVAAIVVRATPHRGAQIVAIAYPVATAYVVIATGNHYVLDVVGGVLVAGLGRYLAVAGHRCVARRRHEAGAAPSIARVVPEPEPEPAMARNAGRR